MGRHSSKCGEAPTCDPASMQFLVDSGRHSALLDPEVFSRHGHVRTVPRQPLCGGQDACVAPAADRGTPPLLVVEKKRERLVGAS